MNCREVSKTLASGTDPGFWKRMQLRLHVMMCDSCAAYERQLEALRESIKTLVASKSSSMEESRKLEDKTLLKVQEIKRSPV